jgi:hypothetical protein
VSGGLSRLVILQLRDKVAVEFSADPSTSMRSKMRELAHRSANMLALLLRYCNEVGVAAQDTGVTEDRIHLKLCAGSGRANTLLHHDRSSTARDIFRPI